MIESKATETALGTRVVIGSTITEFKTAVQNKLNDGWDLCGNMVVSIHGNFIQAMTKVELKKRERGK